MLYINVYVCQVYIGFRDYENKQIVCSVFVHVQLVNKLVSHSVVGKEMCMQYAYGVRGVQACLYVNFFIL